MSLKRSFYRKSKLFYSIIYTFWFHHEDVPEHFVDSMTHNQRSSSQHQKHSKTRIISKFISNFVLLRIMKFCRSQWPRGLRHELSSLVRTLDREFYCVFVLGSGLATGWSLVQGVLLNVLDKETEVKRSVSRVSNAPSGSNRNKPTIMKF
jgi:hypothetical protein